MHLMQTRPMAQPAMHPWLWKAVTFAITSLASALIAWGALRQQVQDIDASGSTYMRQELKEIRRELQAIAVDQARTAAAVEMLSKERSPKQ